MKEDKIALELKLKDMTKELTARDLHIKLLNEKLRNKESEKRLKIEHADLLCNVSDLILKFLKRLEGSTDPSIRRDIDQLQEQAYRLSTHRS